MSVKVITVRRFDAPGAPAKPELLPNGWLRCDAVLTKAGIFKYRNPDGTERRELRLPDEVFSPDSMKSFHLVPVTDDHPEVGWLDATNSKQFSCGSADMPVRDGDKMRARLLVTDAGLVAKIVNREKVQVSNGYFADLEMRSGEYEGESFDAIQRNIRGNHVAIVDEARAGPDARIKLDNADAIGVPFKASDASSAPGAANVNMTKIRIDKVDHEMPETAAQAVAAHMDKAAQKIAERDAQIEQLTAETGTLAGRADAMAAELKKAQSALATATDPKTVAALVAGRVDLVSKARTVIGEDFKGDGMTDRQVKIAAVVKLSPSAKLDDKSDDYVNARFDAAIEAADGKGGITAVRVALNDGAAGGGEPPAPVPDSRTKFMQDSQNAWQTKLTATKKTSGKIKIR